VFELEVIRLVGDFVRESFSGVLNEDFSLSRFFWTSSLALGEVKLHGLRIQCQQSG
jgi:hypothetical protein